MADCGVRGRGGSVYDNVGSTQVVLMGLSDDTLYYSMSIVHLEYNELEALLLFVARQSAAMTAILVLQVDMMVDICDGN
jgi:energy-converting hydrogenase Eha subunit E